MAYLKKYAICRPLLFAGLLILSCSTMVHAQKDTIQWRIVDWPPIYIVNGPYKGQGAGDELIKLFSGRMPEYHHEKVLMSNARFVAEARKGAHILNATGLPAAHLKTSIPSGIILPPQVIMRKDKLLLLNDLSEISLDELLGDKRFKAGVTFGRYGKLINPIIDRHKEKDWVNNTPSYINTIKMLFAERIDYTIEYPDVIQYFETIEGKKGRVNGIPIKEVMAFRPYFIGFVVCTDSQWGSRVLEKINRILKKERNTPHYRKIMLKWTDKDTHELLNTYLDEVFSK